MSIDTTEYIMVFIFQITCLLLGFIPTSESLSVINTVISSAQVTVKPHTKTIKNTDYFNKIVI